MRVVGNLMEVILYVQDMAKQVTFYRDILGLPVTYPAETEDFSDQFWVTLNTGACTLALHGGGQGRLGADSPKIVFQVDDMDAARQALQSKDVFLGELRSPAPGISVCDGRDPEGNPFSLEQHS